MNKRRNEILDCIAKCDEKPDDRFPLQHYDSGPCDTYVYTTYEGENFAAISYQYGHKMDSREAPRVDFDFTYQNKRY